MKTYSPLPKTNFKLSPETVAREKAIHAIQVRYPGIDLNQRKGICEVQKWKPEERIPELSEDIRISVDALEQMVQRNEKKPENTHTDLAKICERYKTKVEKPAEKLSSEEYWYELAFVLFEGFENDPDINKEELNFKVISEAYNDFLG